MIETPKNYDELIEAMARALWTADIAQRCPHLSPEDWRYDQQARLPETGPGFIERWEGQARAAIAAIEAAGCRVVPVSTLKECEAELDDCYRRDHPGADDYPDQARRLQRDMDANPARRALKCWEGEADGHD